MAINATILNGAPMQLLDSFSWSEYFAIVKPLSIFIIGITLYSIFIFKFYRFYSSRDVFSFQIHRYSDMFEGLLHRVMKKILHSIEIFLIIPIMVFFWFCTLTALLILLSKNQSLSQIILIGFAVVATVRITAYYNEDLSKDLGKMVPFALLGVFLTDTSYFSIESAVNNMSQLSSFGTHLIYYLLFVIVLELILRIVHEIYSFLFASVPNVKEEELQ